MLISAATESLLKSAAPCELEYVMKDIEELSGQSSNAAVEEYIHEHGSVFSGSYIAHSLTKDTNTTKHIDYVSRKKFTALGKTALDIEEFSPDLSFPQYFDDLAEKLRSYGQEHYPSTYAFTIVPESDTLAHIIIIGQKLSEQNFYSGQWKAQYTVLDQNITGSVWLDIHYFENGNVRLKFEDTFSKTIDNAHASDIVNAISKIEKDVTVRIATGVEQLNQATFKNLRRLLPVTRSKINWGKAIGNYKLGSDVINAK